MNKHLEFRGEYKIIRKSQTNMFKHYSIDFIVHYLHVVILRVNYRQDSETSYETFIIASPFDQC